MASNIHEAIIEIMKEVGYVQKKKSGKLPYSFAGEAAFIKAVRPTMIEHGVFVYPFSVDELNLEGYLTSSGTHMNRTTAKFGFRFVHAPTETFFEVQVLGQGADVGDKDANKAMTAALKYALRQSLLIETGNDPDETPSKEQERVEPKGQKRPYQPEVLKKRVSKMATQAKNKGATAPEKTRNILAKQLNKICGSDEERYDLCGWLVGYKSTKKMPANYVWALLRWMGVETFEEVPADVVKQEAAGALVYVLEGVD